MKNIEIDEDLYQYIAKNTQFIGESASSILRRLLSVAEVQDTKLAPVDEKINKQVALVSTQSNLPSSTGSIFDYINKEELATQRGVVGRFLLILAALYRVHADQFSVVCEIRGSNRLYFSASENDLVESGSSTKPIQIQHSPYWVITNTNTTRKKMMLTKVASALGYNEQDVDKICELLQ